MSIHIACGAGVISAASARIYLGGNYRCHSRFLWQRKAGEREIFVPRGFKQKERGGGWAMNITALINRKTATKRNETKANLDVVVSSSINQTPQILKIAQENQPLILKHCFALRKSDLSRPVWFNNPQNCRPKDKEARLSTFSFVEKVMYV